MWYDKAKLISSDGGRDIWGLWTKTILLAAGIVIVFSAASLPWEAERKRAHLLTIALCLAGYGISEVAVTFFFDWNWLLTYALWILGGIALSVAVGRSIKAIWSNIRRKAA